MKNKSGFTVIELLIVIAILSILAGTLMINFFSLNNEARSTKVEGDLRVLKIAIENYSITRNKFPSTLLELEGGPTLATLPRDPYNGNSGYQYYYNGNYFCVWSIGVNGDTGIVAITSAGVVSDTDTDDIGITNGACPNQFWR